MNEDIHAASFRSGFCIGAKWKRSTSFILKSRETEGLEQLPATSRQKELLQRVTVSHSLSWQPSVTMSDPCSFSTPSRCVTKHLNLSLRLDFDRRVIWGRVELTVEALEDRFSSLVSVCCCC